MCRRNLQQADPGRKYLPKAAFIRHKSAVLLHTPEGRKALGEEIARLPKQDMLDLLSSILDGFSSVRESESLTKAKAH